MNLLGAEDMPRITVIIPSYNRGEFVTKAVESVLNQTWNDREIILVDDGSTDNTRHELTPFLGKIRYIYQENSGVSSARNTGILAAKGEWLAFLDSDDLWLPDYLSVQLDYLDLHAPAVCMQSTDCTFFGHNGEALNYFTLNGTAEVLNAKSYLQLEAPFVHILSHGPWQLGATIFSHEAVRNSGMFDVRLSISEDIDLMARVALRGNFGLIGRSLVHIYRQNELIRSLTEQAFSHPIEARLSDEMMYGKLATYPELKVPQRKILRKLMSANRRAIGNIHFQNGNLSEARECYRRSVSFECSLRSIGKYLWSFI